MGYGYGPQWLDWVEFCSVRFIFCSFSRFVSCRLPSHFYFEIGQIGTKSGIWKKTLQKGREFHKSASRGYFWNSGNFRQRWWNNGCDIALNWIEKLQSAQCHVIRKCGLVCLERTKMNLIFWILFSGEWKNDIYFHIFKRLITFFEVSRLNSMFPKPSTTANCCTFIMPNTKLCCIFIGNKYHLHR